MLILRQSSVQQFLNILKSSCAWGLGRRSEVHTETPCSHFVHLSSSTCCHIPINFYHMPQQLANLAIFAQLTSTTMTNRSPWCPCRLTAAVLQLVKDQSGTDPPAPPDHVDKRYLWLHSPVSAAMGSVWGIARNHDRLMPAAREVAANAMVDCIRSRLPTAFKTLLKPHRLDCRCRDCHSTRNASGRLGCRYHQPWRSKCIDPSCLISRTGHQVSGRRPECLRLLCRQTTNRVSSTPRQTNSRLIR